MISALAKTRVAPQPKGHGGRFVTGRPRMVVVHCTESPAGPGRAMSNARYVMSKNLSVHYFVDNHEIVNGLDEALIGYGAGDVNRTAIHIEICGYARWTRAEWIANAGPAIKLAGQLLADIHARRNIAARWLTDSEVLACYRHDVGTGWTTHGQCSRLGIGTTHTDPGPNFPYDLLLAYADPNPTVQEDDMPLTDADIDRIATATAKKILGTPLTTTDYSVRPPKPRVGTVLSSLKDNSNFSSGAAYNAGQASIASRTALAELQEGMKA